MQPKPTYTFSNIPLPAGKRALYGVLRYLVRPIRHLL